MSCCQRVQCTSQNYVWSCSAWVNFLVNCQLEFEKLFLRDLLCKFHGTVTFNVSNQFEWRVFKRLSLKNRFWIEMEKVFTRWSSSNFNSVETKLSISHSSVSVALDFTIVLQQNFRLATVSLHRYRSLESWWKRHFSRPQNFLRFHFSSLLVNLFSTTDMTCEPIAYAQTFFIRHEKSLLIVCVDEGHEKRHDFS